MFGHQDDKSAKQDTNDNLEGTIQDALNVGLGQVKSSTGVNEPATVTDPDRPSGAPPPSPSGQDWQHPGTPVDNDPGQIRDVISPAGGYPRSTSSQLPTASVTPVPVPAVSTISTDDYIDPTAAEANELIGIKHKALDELLPLIDQLDQSPEEKFRTIMMMIQAGDDQSLVKKAYEAAHAIGDEKIHAQALLDIVNEINYFTQQPGS